MALILAVDQGSSHTRATLFTDRGKRLAACEAPLRTYCPSPGVVEQDPKELLKSAQTAISGVLRKTHGKTVAALGLANQRSTFLCWNGKTGEPYSPAISWQARGTFHDEQTFQKRWAYPNIEAKTGLPLTPYYSATKLNHVLRGVRRDHLVAGTVNTFLIWHLTQGRSFLTDPTNAQRMLLYNIITRQWDDDLLRHFNIPNILPDILPNQSFFGEARINGCRIPITASIGDQQGSLIGLGGLHAGAANVNYGSGGFLLVHTGDMPVSIPGLLVSIARSDKTDTTYLVEGTVNAVGTLFTWLQQVGILESAANINAACRRAKRGVLFLPALSGLGAPHWKSSAQGGLFGLTTATSKEEIIRGAVEGIAHRINEIYQVLPAKIRRTIRVVTATGGGARIPFLLQFQADLFNKRIGLSTDLESTVRGAAFLAGKEMGLTDESSFAFSTVRKEIAPHIPPKVRERLAWKQFMEKWCSAFYSPTLF